LLFVLTNLNSICTTDFLFLGGDNLIDFGTTESTAVSSYPIDIVVEYCTERDILDKALHEEVVKSKWILG
jgi:hypothetical protein